MSVEKKAHQIIEFDFNTPAVELIVYCFVLNRILTTCSCCAYIICQCPDESGTGFEDAVWATIGVELY